MSRLWFSAWGRFVYDKIRFGYVVFEFVFERSKVGDMSSWPLINVPTGQKGDCKGAGGGSHLDKSNNIVSNDRPYLIKNYTISEGQVTGKG